MARTYRNNPDDQWLRRPKTKREITQLKGLEVDEYTEYDEPVGKRNRRHRHIPDSYDDLRINAN